MWLGILAHPRLGNLELENYPPPDCGVPTVLGFSGFVGKSLAQMYITDDDGSAGCGCGM